MARFFLIDSTRRRTFLIAICALAPLWVKAPIALAQSAPHAAPSPGARMAAPPHLVTPPPHPPRFALAPPIGYSFPPRFHPLPNPLVTGMTVPFRFPLHPIFFPRRFRFGSPFLGTQFFQGGIGLGFTTWWMPNCSPDWAFGYYCSGLPPANSSFVNYFTLQPYQPSVYSYTPEGQPLVWLFLKNGTVYSVTDYWFVNGQLHFITIEESGAKSAEQAISSSDLDVQKTVDVNTRRGFRVVMRDQPLDQYIRNRPGTIPPLLQSPPEH